MSGTSSSAGSPQPGLDQLDRRLLFEVDRDPTVDARALAGLVGAGPEEVESRLAALFANGVIRYSMPIVNLDRLGFSVFLVDLELADPGARTTLLSRFRGHPHVGWLVDTTVPTVVMSAIFARSAMDCRRVLAELLRPLGDAIAEADVSTVYEKYVLGQRYLTIHTRVTDFVFDNSRIAFESAEADELGEPERSLLSRLRELRSRSLDLVSREVGLSRDGVTALIADLRRRNIVVKFQPVYDVQKLGYRWFLVSVRTGWLESSRREELLDFIHAFTHVVHINCMIGKWDLNFEVHSNDESELNLIIRELESRFGDVLRDHAIRELLMEYKFNFLTDCVLEAAR